MVEKLQFTYSNLKNTDCNKNEPNILLELGVK